MDGGARRTCGRADNIRLFRIGDGDGWRTAALKPGKWGKMVMERGCTFRRKIEAKEADSIPITPGVTAGQLRRFWEALIGPLQHPSPGCHFSMKKVFCQSVVYAQRNFFSAARRSRWRVHRSDCTPLSLPLSPSLSFVVLPSQMSCNRSCYSPKMTCPSNVRLTCQRVDLSDFSPTSSSTVAFACCI